MRARLLFWSAAFAITFGDPRAARAVGVSGTPTPSVREEYVLVVDDAPHRLEHVLYAARLDTAATAFSMGVPTPSRPELEVLASLDLAKLVHSLIAPYVTATAGVEPVAPPPWETRGVAVTLRAIDAGTADPSGIPFDATWLHTLAAEKAWLGVLDLTAPAGRVEATTPTVRVSFATDRPHLLWREPLADAREPGASGPGALDVDRVETAPPKIAPEPDVVTKILRVGIADTLLCLDGPDRPTAPVTIDIEGSVDRHGATTRLEATAPGTLAACVASATRKKTFPREDAPWTFRATLRLTPPAVASRRTHVVVLGMQRLEANERAHLTAVRELEPRPADLAAALGPAMLHTLGLDGGRLWLTEYVDRSARRTSDVEWTRTGFPPPDGERGTIGFAVKAARAREPGAPDRARPARHRLSSRTRKALGFSAFALFALALGALVMRRGTS